MSLYDLINNAVKLCNVVINSLQELKLYENEEKQLTAARNLIGHIRALLRDCSSDKLYEIFCQQMELNSLGSINQELLNVVVFILCDAVNNYIPNSKDSLKIKKYLTSNSQSKQNDFAKALTEKLNKLRRFSAKNSSTAYDNANNQIFNTLNVICTAPFKSREFLYTCFVEILTIYFAEQESKAQIPIFYLEQFIFEFRGLLNLLDNYARDYPHWNRTRLDTLLNKMSELNKKSNNTTVGRKRSGEAIYDDRPVKKPKPNDPIIISQKYILNFFSHRYKLNELYLFLDRVIKSDNLINVNIATIFHRLGLEHPQYIILDKETVDKISQLLELLKKKSPEERHIFNAVQGLGKLAENRSLVPEDFSPNMQNNLSALVEQLNKKKPKAQDIAGTINGLGKLVGKHCLVPVNFLRIKDFLLNLIKNLIKLNPNTQEIANTIHGLGKLVERQCLVPKDFTKNLKTDIQIKQNPNTQEIANAVHGLEKLVERQCLVSNDITDNLKTDIQALLKQLNDKQPNAQGIANSLYGLGKLAEYHCLLPADFIQDLKDNLKSLIQQLIKENPETQNIANTIHSLGKLAENKCLVSDDCTQDLKDNLKDLIQQVIKPDLNAQEIANIVHGLGKLAENKCLVSDDYTKDLKANLITLIQNLINKNPKTLEITNTIYGLWKLVECGCLLRINVDQSLQSTLQTLIQRLTKQKPTTREIASIVYGLGKLVEKKCLLPNDLPNDFIIKFKPNLLILLAEQFKQLKEHPCAYDAAITLHGLGKLAEKRCLVVNDFNQNLKDSLKELIQQLIEQKPNIKDIASTIHGLGKLTENGCLVSKDFTQALKDDLKKLMQLLKEKTPHAKNIASIIHGLAKLAEYGCLLPADMTQDLIITLQNFIEELNKQQPINKQQPNMQEIANVVYGLGKLVERQCLIPNDFTDKLKTNLQNLIQQLVKQQPNMQSIANTLYGLGKLAENDCLTAADFSLDLKNDLIILIQQLAEQQPTSQEVANTLHVAEQQPTSQEIANTLHGLGKLAENRCLTEADFSQALKNNLITLIQKLTQLKPTSQEIANALHGIGKLTENYCLVSKDFTQALKDSTRTLKYYLKLLIEKLTKQETNPIDTANTIHAIGKLVEKCCLVSADFTQPLKENLKTLTQRLGLVGQKPTSQNIANTIHGLSKLVNKKCLLADDFTSTLKVDLQELILCLIKQKHIRQDISNTLYGLGLLAKAKICLPQSFFVYQTLLHNLLLKFDYKSTVHINCSYFFCSSLAGLGYLVISENLNSIITQQQKNQFIRDINKLVCCIARLKLNAHKIAFILEAISYFWVAEILPEQQIKEIFIKLAQQFIHKDPDQRDMENLLNGFNKLSVQQKEILTNEAALQTFWYTLKQRFSQSFSQLGLILPPKPVEETAAPDVILEEKSPFTWERQKLVLDSSSLSELKDRYDLSTLDGQNGLTRKLKEQQIDFIKPKNNEFADIIIAPLQQLVVAMEHLQAKILKLKGFSVNI